eukprot:355589-Chlamydomonas_euryale.AAC.9
MESDVQIQCHQREQPDDHLQGQGEVRSHGSAWLLKDSFASTVMRAVMRASLYTFPAMQTHGPPWRAQAIPMAATRRPGASEAASLRRMWARLMILSAKASSRSPKFAAAGRTASRSA